MKKCLTLVLLLAASGAWAEAPWGNADVAAGKAHHDKACISCHTRMYGGDGSHMYSREGRQLSDRLELLQRVASCAAQFKAGWFPEEEAEVAAYLNQQYYQFKK